MRCTKASFSHRSLPTYRDCCQSRQKLPGIYRCLTRKINNKTISQPPLLCMVMLEINSSCRKLSQVQLQQHLPMEMACPHSSCDVYTHCTICRFELILPQSWPEADKKPVYIHLAGTGDHVTTLSKIFYHEQEIFLQYFWRRRLMTVLPTLRSSGIGAVSLENPLYGSRKPPEQTCV